MHLTLYTLPEVPRSEFGRRQVSSYSSIDDLWARQHEVDRALKLLHKGADPKQVLEALSQGLTNKLMHGPTQALNEATSEERRGLAATIARLFRLRT